MKKNILSALVAAALLGTVTLPVAAQNITVVNGKAIPKERAEMLKQQVLERVDGRPLPPELDEQLKEEIILREIFMQEANKRGLGGSKEFEMKLDLARQSILIQELFDNYKKKNPVSDAEIKAEYERLAAENKSKEYKSSHILVENEDEAKEIIAALKKGGKFEELAKEKSKDPGSGANGGDLGWSKPNNFVAEFAGALTQLTKGKTVEAPVQSQFGWHIIRLDDVRDADFPKLEDVKNQVEKHLQEQKLTKFQEELRAKAKIE